MLSSDGLGGTAILRKLIFALAALVLCACSADAILARYETRPETQLARESIELLRAKNYDAVRSKLAPELRDDPEIARGMPLVAGQFPDGEPIGIDLIDYQFTTFSPFGGQASTNYSIAFEYEFSDIWIVTAASLRSVNDETSLIRIDIFRNLQ